MVAENIEPGKGKTHYIEREVEPQREQEGREVEHQFEDSGAVRRGPSETEEKAEGEEGEGRSAEGESVEARVEVPQVLDVDETPEVQANALRLELRVSGRENGHNEVEEDDQVDEEVDCEEEGPQDSLALHRLEGEVAQHPSEESDEGGLEGGELGTSKTIMPTQEKVRRMMSSVMRLRILRRGPSMRLSRKRKRTLSHMQAPR